MKCGSFRYFRQGLRDFAVMTRKLHKRIDSFNTRVHVDKYEPVDLIHDVILHAGWAAARTSSRGSGRCGGVFAIHEIVGFAGSAGRGR